MTESSTYILPSEVTEVIKRPQVDREGFYQYVKKCLVKRPSVYDCTILLAGLDVVARSVVEDLEIELDEGEDGIHKRKELLCCEYLADELRAIRRRIVAYEIIRLEDGRVSVKNFVDSVVLPMSCRTSLPLAYYEPYQPDTEPEIQESGTEPKLFTNHTEHRGSLIKFCEVSGRNAHASSYLDRILFALRNWNLGGESRKTASYLAAADLVRKHARDKQLEVPILLVSRNSSTYCLGHVLRALLVPFTVPCSCELARSSLLPAIEAVDRHFAGSYLHPKLYQLVLGDYPGGVYCRGDAVCIEADKGHLDKCESSQFEGLSAGLAFGAWLAADALRLKVPPNYYATAEITSEGQVRALGNKESKEADLYLEAKGQTIALLAQVCGHETALVVVGNSKNRSKIISGVEKVTKRIKQEQREHRKYNPRLVEKHRLFSCSCQHAHDLQETVHFLFPNMYENVIKKLIGGDDESNRLAKQAACRILADTTVTRWVVVVDARDIDVFGGGQDFETALAQEIYRSSSARKGFAQIPLCFSVDDFFSLYHLYSCEKGMLGRTVADLGEFDLPDYGEQHNIWISQIERDLYEGHLVLVLSGLAEYTSIERQPTGQSHQVYVQKLERLLDDLRCTSGDDSNWKVKSIVIVKLGRGDEATNSVLALLARYGFTKCSLVTAPINETSPSYRISGRLEVKEKCEQ